MSTSLHALALQVYLWVLSHVHQLQSFKTVDCFMQCPLHTSLAIAEIEKKTVLLHLDLTSYFNYY